MSDKDPVLAIVLPTYQTRFLAAALESLALQSDPRFVVHVGDDASRDDVAAVCAPFRSRLRLRVHRWPENLGGRNLVAQWMRCVKLGSEPWVWMIGDDDMLEPGCVAAFHVARAAHPACELFHFDVRRMDAQGALIDSLPEFPSRCTARRFVRGRLLFELSTFAPDFVFSRQAFERVGGFQDFPLAWCSDDATWTKLAARHGIVNVAGPRVRWRLSGSNISSRSAANAQVKVEAQLQFVEWLCGALSSLPRLAGDPDDASLRQWARWWFFEQSQRVGAVFDARDALGMSRRLARADGGSLAGALLRTLRHRLCQPAAGAAPAPASGAGTGTR